jgi:hypothetical protein
MPLAADERDVTSLLSLKYPNGRIAEVEIGETVRDGQELDLYGRRWKVVGRVGTSGSRYVRAAESRLLCRQIRSLTKS